MVVLIDNYDSFSYNLYQLVGEINQDIKVIRNDEMTIEELEKLDMSHLIISPGPGRPKDAGICEEAIKYFAGRVPILGVCLGHQAICETFGATISYANQLMHGKQSSIRIKKEGMLCKKPNLFTAIPENIVVARYHSLVAKSETIPEELEVMATTIDGEIMAVQHKTYPVFGVQFHPESILTRDGKQMLENFLNIA